MTILRKTGVTLSLVAILTILASCNMPRPTAQPQLDLTLIAETVSAQLVLTSLTTPTPSPTITPAPPTATTTPSPSPQPTATVACDDDSQFIADVTIPDYTTMKQGQSFTKTWRLRNSGTCDWTTAYNVVFTGGARMGGPGAVPLSAEVPPNGTIDVSIDLGAPTSNGSFRGNYQIQDAEDKPFGTSFYVQILVGPTPTPSDDIYRSGKLTIDNGATIDFDEAKSTTGPGGDLRVNYVSESERYLEPRNGTRLGESGGKPGRDDCREASLSDASVAFDDFETGSYFCYKTSAGRYGRFQVGRIEEDSIAFDFRTWD
jgi:hypothetical protein